VTANNENITLRDHDTDDEDWCVKQCYMLLIVAASEMGVGREHLWNSDKATSRHIIPDFGHYCSFNTFIVFFSAAPMTWADKSM
jgi:hypothetical protein